MKLGPRQRKLVAFLRNPTVLQACGRLQINGCYCVLGAICKHYEDETVEVLERKEYKFPVPETRLAGSDLSPHPQVQNYFGLYSADGHPEGGEDVICHHVRSVAGENPRAINLMTLNDDFELSFSDFADLLEAFAGHYFEEPK